MTPRGIRNNNPGNIIQSGIAWQGKETPSRDPRFESFDTPLNGIRALCKLLISYQDKHNLNTVRGIINRWAPPVENNTSAYVYSVAAALGVPQDRPIDTHDAATLTKLATAIIQHENGQQPYPPELIAQAVRAAGGMPDTVGVSKPPSSGVAPVTPAKSKVNMDKPASIFGDAIAKLIPQAAKIFLAGSPYAALADTVVQTVVQATGAVNEQQAVEMMSADPVALQKATDAVLTQPDVAALLEVGGGIPEARKFDLAATNAERPFWYSQAFWVTMLVVVPPVDFMVALVIWRMPAPSEQLATQVITGLLGILAVAAAFYFGSSMGSQKKDEALARAGK